MHVDEAANMVSLLVDMASAAAALDGEEYGALQAGAKNSDTFLVAVRRRLMQRSHEVRVRRQLCPDVLGIRADGTRFSQRQIKRPPSTKLSGRYPREGDTWWLDQNERLRPGGSTPLTSTTR